jgi:hypothetical protein
MINISMPAAGGRSHSHARADIGDLATVKDLIPQTSHHPEEGAGVGESEK